LNSGLKHDVPEGISELHLNPLRFDIEMVMFWNMLVWFEHYRSSSWMTLHMKTMRHLKVCTRLWFPKVISSTSVCVFTVWLRKHQRKDGWFQNYSWNVCSGKLYLYYSQRPESGSDAYRPVICNCDHSNCPLALSVYHSM